MSYSRGSLALHVAVVGILAWPAHALDPAPEETPLARNLSGPGAHAGRKKAYIRYRMAQLALRDGDVDLVERFLGEAIAANPDNGALRYEYALFLAGQGKGREARSALEDLAGDADLLARAEYLRAKLKVAERLDGAYVETRKIVIKRDGKQEKRTPDGCLTIDLGRVTWRQNAAGRSVRQAYTFPVQGLCSGKDTYSLDLTYREIDVEESFYVPDRNGVGLTVKKKKKGSGWELVLRTVDATGSKGVIHFESAKADDTASRGSSSKGRNRE